MTVQRVSLATGGDAEAYLFCDACGEDFMIIRESDERVPVLDWDVLRDGIDEHAKHCQVDSRSQPG